MKRMRVSHIIVAYGMAVLLQTSWLSTYPLVGVTANFVLCALVLLRAVSSHPAVYGGAVLCGLLIDLSLGLYVGVSALAYLSVCAVLHVVSDSLNPHNILTSVATVLWATVWYEVVYWLILFLFGSPYHGAYLAARLPALMLANGVTTGVVKGMLR